MAEEKQLDDDINLDDFNFDDLPGGDDLVLPEDASAPDATPKTAETNTFDLGDMSLDDFNFDDILENNTEPAEDLPPFDAEPAAEVPAESADEALPEAEEPAEDLPSFDAEPAAEVPAESADEALPGAEEPAEDLSSFNTEPAAEVSVESADEALPEAEEPAEYLPSFDAEPAAEVPVESADEALPEAEEPAEELVNETLSSEDFSDDDIRSVHEEYFGTEPAVGGWEQNTAPAAAYASAGIKESGNIGCLRWFSGSSDDKMFEVGKGFESGSFNADEECKTVHVNAGYDTYGWEVQFSDGVVMNLRDVREYQIRNGRLPSSDGRIIYGQSSLLFSGVERIVVYESVKYFSYGI